MSAFRVPGLAFIKIETWLVVFKKCSCIICDWPNEIGVFHVVFNLVYLGKFDQLEWLFKDHFVLFVSIQVVEVLLEDRLDLLNYFFSFKIKNNQLTKFVD